MKIELEIPDWPDAENRNIYILRGKEHVAVLRSGTSRWIVKDQRCSQCGQCCKIDHIQGMHLPLNEDESACKLLTPENLCAWYDNRPFGCCIGSPQFEPKCTVTWKVYERTKE